MYDVFNQVVLTQKGQSFVRDHATDFDGQAVWRKLIDDAQTSTAADLDASELSTFIHNMKIDSNWRRNGYWISPDVPGENAHPSNSDSEGFLVYL